MRARCDRRAGQTRRSDRTIPGWRDRTMQPARPPTKADKPRPAAPHITVDQASRSGQTSPGQPHRTLQSTRPADQGRQAPASRTAHYSRPGQPIRADKPRPAAPHITVDQASRSGQTSPGQPHRRVQSARPVGRTGRTPTSGTTEYAGRPLAALALVQVGMDLTPTILARPPCLFSTLTLSISPL